MPAARQLLCLVLLGQRAVAAELGGAGVHQIPNSTDEVERRLALITNEFTPSNTAVTIGLAIGSPILCSPATCSSITGLYAGLEISILEIGVDGDLFFAPGALLRVVASRVDRVRARAGSCLPGHVDSAEQAVVTSPWSEGGSATSGSGTANLQASSALTFKMGGSFRFCYSDDGSFTDPNADVVPPLLHVYGLFDNRPECAATEACLTQRKYRCYLLREAYNNPEDSFGSLSSSCVIDFEQAGRGFHGPAGRGSWSKAFEARYDAQGRVNSVTAGACGANGDVPADFLCRNGVACDLGSPFMDINLTRVPDGGRFRLPPARNDLNGATFGPRTVAACYCPDFAGCDGFSPDFLQQVGILHYYASKVCSSGASATACNPDYTGTTPQHRFAVRIECPTDACLARGQSSLKVVAQRAANNLPSWQAGAGCGRAVHGYDALGRMVLPLEQNILDPAAVHGGERQDYKLWNYPNSSSGYIMDEASSGFLFVKGSNSYELLNLHSGETFDVCYCDDNCTVDENWFKVGHLRFAPFQLVSAATNESVVQEELLIEYVNQPGTLGFYRPWVDYGVQGLQFGGTAKLVADPSLTLDDAGCAAAGYDGSLLEPSGFSEVTAYTRYRGANSTLPSDRSKLIFNAGDTANVITVKRAGVLAVCYCSQATETGCQGQAWILAARLTVRGPNLGQSWSFSTHVVFRFNFSGFGLTADDRVRLIPSTSTCSGDPDAASTATSIKIDCPSPCSEIGSVTSAVNGDIAVTPYADNTYLCDERNENCRTNYIVNVTVLDENATALRFEHPHLLKPGDLLTLGENFHCHAEDPAIVCGAERLAILKGRYRLVDGADNSAAAPDEYIAGHAVTTTADPAMVTIAVGWPDPKPRFVVRSVGGVGGRWTRHSEAETKQEIIGVRERVDMKVCWKYAPAQRAQGPPPSYVGQVGTLTLRDANTLALCRVTLSAGVMDQNAPYAPFILSFKTASEQTGRRYSQVEGTTRLRIFLDQRASLYAVFTDGSAIAPNTAEDDIAEARQYICGRLFKELWSSDTHLGFPMPKGCYYRSYDQTQELNLIFERKNGFKADSHYQLVLLGMASRFAVTNGEYAQVFTMDDTELKPYVAIERGLAQLTRGPEAPWYGADGVKFAEPNGLRVLGGNAAGLLELIDGQTLRIELRGDGSYGGIKPGSVLRLFLWPLTQWDVPQDCTAVCVPQDDVTTPCGAIQSCRGEALLTNFQKNFLRIVMPAAMTTIQGAVVPTLALPGLKLPGTGFFPLRFGAQVTQPDDTKPHYVETGGAWIYKTPDEGQFVGKVVSRHGDGNTLPFRGDAGNVLYVRLVLAAMIFSASTAGEASMTLVLPRGYECLRPDDIDGESPWRAEETLGAFAGEVPKGLGLPDEGSGTRGWSVSENRCVFTLRKHGVVYAGSALTLRVTANNPSFPLRVGDTENRWYVLQEGKGGQSASVSFPPQLFKTSGLGDFSNNVAVLGRLTAASLVPTSFAASSGARVATGELRVFFRTEQETGVSSGVELRAPPGFLFLPQAACQAGNLPDAYYAARADGTGTLRLPGILTCSQSSSPYNRATIRVAGSMLARRFYGFRIANVQNPATTGNVAEQQAEWRLTTIDSSNGYVDGLKQPMPLAPHGGDRAGLGLYRHDLNAAGAERVAVVISDLRPYSLSGQKATVRLLPLQLPENSTATLRVVAPQGFLWDFDGSEFKHRAPVFNVTDPQALEGVTADLPGGLPAEVNGSVLAWPAASYDAGQVYGFEALVRVPDRTPTSSVNEFLVEFGYDATNVADRIAAAAVEARVGSVGGVPAAVRALAGVAVGYSTNVQGKANNLTFQVTTATAIPAGGGLRILGPSGFTVQGGVCSVSAAPMQRGSEYDLVAPTAPLPAGVTCQNSVAAGGGALELRLQAPAGGEIPPGRYRFQILALNPAQPLPNPATNAQGSPCGFAHCWRIESLADLADPRPTVLDASASVPSFPVNQRLLDAGLANLTVAQRAATKRDDRPSFFNPLVFVFKLNRDVTTLTVLRVRAPLGSVFRENCLEDVELRSARVFGADGTQPLPAGHGVWPTNVTALACRGEGPNAFISVDGAGEPGGLRSGLLYPFRVALLRNPATKPAVNEWALEIAGESSEPFTGYELWTFGRKSVTAAFAGRSAVGSSSTLVGTPVTLNFNPLNGISGAGMKIRVTAPTGFRMVHDRTVCTALIQLVTAFPTGFEMNNDTAPHPNFAGPASLLWRDADIACAVDAATERVLTVTVLGELDILAGRDYQLSFRVRNPSFTASASPWLLETEASALRSAPLAVFRDWALIEGFAVTQRTSRWLYRNEDPITGLPHVTGVTDVPGLLFEMQFPAALVRDDIVRVTAPRGFELATGAAGACRGFRWQPPANASNALPNSLVRCEGGVLRFVVREPATVPAGRVLQFRLDTMNPPKTPHIMENYWTVEHLDSTATTLRSAGAMESWTILPQLYNVKVFLIGPLKAEASISSLAVSFWPVSDADQMTLAARKPTGFDFTGCTTTSVGHEVIATALEEVRVRASIFSGVQVDVFIDRLRFGDVGGATEFDVATLLNNGIRMDEKRGFRGGFRLPGRVTQTGNSTLRSKYALEPSLYPVSSLWETRMGERARADFEFKLSIAAVPSMTLRLQAPPYTLLAEGFSLTRVNGELLVAAEVISANAGGLVARLNAPLVAEVSYRARVNVITPLVPNPTDAMWSIDVFDGGELPVNTNDGLTDGFLLVDRVGLGLTVERSPPLALVEVTVDIDPRSTRPTELRIVAPPGFDFPADCLASGGLGKVVAACAKSGELQGRAVAKLTSRVGGLMGRTEKVKILVRNPPLSATLPTWYIEGRSAVRQVAWGEDPEGIVIQQMQGASVLHPGVPSISGQLVYTFITSVPVPAGGTIVAGYPKSLTVSCDGAFLQKISLEGTVRCENKPREGRFDLLLSRPLPAGTQAFAVTSISPYSIREANVFYAQVLDPAGAVVDAAMNIPGTKIQHGLALAALPLIWGLAEANETTSLSLGFELLQALPELNPPVMSELVVELPPDFSHQIMRLWDIEVINDPMPWRGTGNAFLDVSKGRRVSFLLDEAATTKLAVGRYRFVFPILVPPRMPKYNVFTLTICGPQAVGQMARCTGSADPRALVSFPLAGFNMGEVHPSSRQFAVVAGHASGLPRHVLLPLLLLFLPLIRRLC